MVVAAVAVEFERWENFILSVVVAVVEVYREERLVVERDLFLLCPFIDPEKKSPTEPGRPLKRLRDIASRPNIATLERAVGVVGSEFLPVLNSKRPN